MAVELGEDLRTSLRQLLQSSFEELNLLTRQQLESQTQALDRAEQRLEELATEIAAMEEKIQLLETESN